MIDRPIALAAAGFVIAGEHGDAFQESRFTRPVLADDDGDGTIEILFEVVLQERQAEWIGRAVGDARWLEPDPPQVRRRHVDRFIPSGHALKSAEQDCRNHPTAAPQSWIASQRWGLICPTGKSAKSRQAPLAKIF